ncbi:MAG: MoxR family ATPase [Clostridia bacterium]|nr:MoxR family ATPase [Clostridia bacterium]
MPNQDNNYSGAAAGAQTQQVSRDYTVVNSIIENICRYYSGGRRSVLLTVTALLAGGHLLLEDVPGVGKTTLAKALTGSVSGTFKRVSLTPDVLPSDLTGFSVYNRKTEAFEFKKGALDCNFLLADEINRTSPKTQSSLLEAMQEEKVSVDGVTYELPQPFMVIATQNPIELAGTYPLPEAQLDRFLMKLSLGYPDPDGEKHVITAGASVRRDPEAQPVATCADIIRLQDEVNQVYLSDSVADYILRLLSATRSAPDLALGLSPRAGISLAKTAKALAFLSGRNYVLPDDIKQILIPVCAHRLMLTRDAKAAGQTAVGILEGVRKKVPVE